MIFQKKCKCIINIGHTPESPGAINGSWNISEFEFNSNIAEILKVESPKNTEIKLVYQKQYTDLPAEINEFKPDYIISLHCNAFNKKTRGTEVLFLKGSTKGESIANILLDSLLKLNFQDRGIKARTENDRGGYLLKNTIAPCVISEPFFIDNNDDCTQAHFKLDGLITAYLEAINNISYFFNK
jgi:N-acetylmuramoyl-L-alanine amidase